MPHIQVPSQDMPLFDFPASIARLLASSKQVEDSDQRLERAQALFEEHRDAMDPPDCDLAQSLLE